MSTLVLDHRDLSLDYENECLLIRQPQQPPRTIPLNRLARILVMHSVQITTRLIGQCQHRGVDFIVLNGRHHEHSFAILACHQRQAARRVLQYRIASNEVNALPLAKRLVRHKLAATRRCLRRRNADKDRLASLGACQQAVKECSSLQQLRGIEGNAQRETFKCWREQLPAQLGFNRRERRPPSDPVNVVLSLSFTLLYQEASRQSLIHGLDPWLGIYHQLTPGRLSLACDLIEPLRPAIEAWVVQLFCDGELDKRHFSTSGQGCRLGKHGREIYYRLWHDRLPRWTRHLSAYAALFARHLEQMAASSQDGANAWNTGT